jgi:hypothetical protein
MRLEVELASRAASAPRRVARISASLRGVDVDRDDVRAARRGDLHAEAADSPDADEDREIAGPRPLRSIA